jgi:hypothetical protein
MDVVPKYYKFGTQITHNLAKQLSTAYDIKGNVISFQNTVPEGKIVHIHGKRNLSSLSTSSRPAYKKSKPFVSPNRFEVLQSDDDSSEYAFSHLVIILQYVRLSLDPLSTKTQPVLNRFTLKI